MKLSLTPMAAAVEDAPLLPNANKKDLPTTDSKTTTTKKGYSVVRLSVAFGTCAVLLLGVVFCADRGGGDKINTNVVHNTIRSSGKEKLEYCVDDIFNPVRTCYKGEEDKCPGYPTDLKKKRYVRHKRYLRKCSAIFESPRSHSRQHLLLAF